LKNNSTCQRCIVDPENESACIHKLDLLAQKLVNFEDNLISSREQTFCRQYYNKLISYSLSLNERWDSSDVIFIFLDYVSPYCYVSNMAHIHKKMKKGRPYYYVRETARVNGKPKVVNQVYLGSPKRIMEMAAGIGGEIKKLQVQEYGSLLIGDLIEKEIDIAAIVDEVVGEKENKDGPSVGDYFFYTILTRFSHQANK